MSLQTDKIQKLLKLKDSYWVFTNGLSMEKEVVKNLLKEPRDKIIHDMELFLAQRRAF